MNLFTELNSLPEDKKGIGKVFLQYSTFMMSYIDYCSSEEARSEWIKEKMKKSVFKSFLTETYKNPILNSLKIEDMLIKPIQRICKYPLLLRVCFSFIIFLFFIFYTFGIWWTSWNR